LRAVLRTTGTTARASLRELPETVAELSAWTGLLANLTGSAQGPAPAVHSIVSEVVEDADDSR
jgi:hypothetical protein